MRILVTGGTGFIGKHLIIKLLEEGYNLLALSRSIEEFNLGNNLDTLKWMQSSIILNEENLKGINEFKPEVIIHLAWENIPDFSFETCFINLQNQINFFKKICQIESINKIIVSGSCWEYNKKFGACNENEHVFSENYFTWAKNSIREYLEIECLQKNINFFWTRIFYVYGPGQRSGSLIPLIMNDIFNGKVPNILKPNNSNDFIYIDDVVFGFIQLIKTTLPSGIYNLGTGKSTSVLEILKIFDLKINGNNNITNQVLKYSINIAKETDCWSDTKKTKLSLNCPPLISIEDGIQKIYNKYMII
jgi:nucleoside-diphosphate-sugar epimerase